MIIPDYFKFFNKTRILSGKKALENIPYELKSMDAVKPLVITDKKKINRHAASELVKAYGDSGLVIGAVYDGAEIYASSKIVSDAYTLFKARGCDAVISIGGEIPASVARGVNLMASQQSEDLLKTGPLPETMQLKPFIVIATSGSSGIETSGKAVIEGRDFQSPELMPDIVVIDPRNIMKTDLQESIIMGLSGLALSVEASSQELANPFNDSFAFASIKLIYENLTEIIKGNNSSKVRLGFANGLAISGIVASNSPAGLTTVLAEEIFKSTGHSRELCRAIILPHLLDYKLKNSKEGVRGELLLPLAGIETYCSIPEAARGEHGVDMIMDLLISAQRYMPVSFQEIKVPLYIIQQAGKSVQSMFSKQYGKGGIMEILKSAYGSIQSGEV